MTISRLILGPLQTNCYIVSDRQRCIVVDPADQAADILSHALDYGLTIEKIVLTHGHFDHMLALERLREATGAPLCIHSADNGLLTDPAGNLSGNPAFRFFGGEKTYRPAEILLEEGDTISVGQASLTVLHTPGHTRGSICLACGTDMITGDTLFAGSMGRIDFPGGSDQDMLSSLQRLAGLETDYTIYPGHGPSSTLEKERKTNPYLQF